LLSLHHPSFYRKLFNILDRPLSSLTLVEIPSFVTPTITINKPLFTHDYDSRPTPV
jgi:hypothetical protein